MHGRHHLQGLGNIEVCDPSFHPPYRDSCSYVLTGWTPVVLFDREATALHVTYAETLPLPISLSPADVLAGLAKLTCRAITVDLLRSLRPQLVSDCQFQWLSVGG